jgi:hypothetical protein
MFAALLGGFDAPVAILLVVLTNYCRCVSVLDDIFPGFALEIRQFALLHLLQFDPLHYLVADGVVGGFHHDRRIFRVV